MAGSRAGLKKVVKMVRGKKGTTRRTYWMKSEGAGAPKQGFLRRHAGKLVAGAALAAGGAYLAHKHRGAIGGAAKGALEGYRAVRNLGRGLGTGSSMKERLAGAGLGAAIRGTQGRAADKMRNANSTLARTQLKNRAGFVASGLRDVASSAIRDKASSVAATVRGVGSGVVAAGRALRHTSNLRGKMGSIASAAVDGKRRLGSIASRAMKRRNKSS
jgi:hypothetical protein